MGTVSDRELRKRPVDVPAGMPMPVGSISARQKTTATVIEKKDGIWQYGEKEVEIHVWVSRHREVVLGGPNAAQVLLWNGVEVILASTAESRARWKHAHLVAALCEPASQNWWWKAPFLPAYKKETVAKKLARLAEALKTARSDEDVEAGLVRTVRGEGALPRALAELNFDPFETDYRWLTARMPDPMRFHWNDIAAVDEEGYAVSRNRARRSGPKPATRNTRPIWSFGICKDVEEAHKDLMTQLQADKRLYKLPRRPGGPHSIVTEEERDIRSMAVWYALAGRVRSRTPLDRALKVFHDAAEYESKSREQQPGGNRQNSLKRPRSFNRRLIDVQ